MNEASLKAGLRPYVLAAMPGCVWIRHEDRSQGGNPDATNTWQKCTSWWEFKLDTPTKPILLPPLQLDTCRRLEREGYCRYVIWSIGKDKQKMTYIVKPSYVLDADIGRLNTFSPELTLPGFDHRGVASFMRGVHVLHGRRP